MKLESLVIISLLVQSLTATILKEGYTGCGFEEIFNEDGIGEDVGNSSDSSKSIVRNGTNMMAEAKIERRGLADRIKTSGSDTFSRSSSFRKLGMIIGVKKSPEFGAFKDDPSFKRTHTSHEGGGKTQLHTRDSRVNSNLPETFQSNCNVSVRKTGTNCDIRANEIQGECESENFTTSRAIPQKRDDEPAAYHRILISLTRFFGDLRSYIRGKRFDRIHFEKVIQNLRADISDIEFSVETELSSDILKEKLEFSRKMFQAMVDSSEKLKRYAHFSFSGNRLVYDMIELPIRIMALFTIDGTLDRQIHEYPEKLKHFGRILENRDREFKNVTYVRPGVEEVFTRNMENARGLLQKLQEDSGK